MTLTSNLTHLESVGLVRLAVVRPELEFIFRHALVHEAAYQSLLKADRRTLHQLIGETLERLYAERLAELAPLLAQHFALAGDDERALKYFTLAGDEAMRVYANAEAIQHYTHALDIVQRVGAQDSASLHPSIQHLYLRRGRALELSNRFTEAVANDEAMLALAQKREERALKLSALMALVTLLAIPSPVADLTRAQALSEQSLALAHELNDHAAEAKILWNLLLLNNYAGRTHAAIQYGQQALALARVLNLREQSAFILNDLGRTYRVLSQIEQAQAVLNEACELWRELGNLPMLSDSLRQSAVLYYNCGEYNQSVISLNEALGLSQSSGDVWGQSFSQMWLGYIYFEQGEVAKTIEALELAIRLGEQAKFPGVLIGARFGLAMLYGMLGAIERGLELGHIALMIAEAQLPIWQPWPIVANTRLHFANANLIEAEATYKKGNLRPTQEYFNRLFIPGAVGVSLAYGELTLAKQDYTSVVIVIDDLLDYLNHNAIYTFVSEALYLKSQALLAQGRSDEAYSVLSEARSKADALGIRRMVWQIYAALSDLEAQRGNHTEAQALRIQAREVIAYITEHCPPELRESFLNLPEVRSVHRET